MVDEELLNMTLFTPHPTSLALSHLLPLEKAYYTAKR